MERVGTDYMGGGRAEWKVSWWWIEIGGKTNFILLVLVSQII